MADGLRPRRLLAAKSPREETQEACDGAQADTRHEKEWQGQEDPGHRGPGDKRLRWARELTQTRRGRVAGVGGAGARRGEARDLVALGAMGGAARRGCVLPLLATMCDLGEWAHHAGSWQTVVPEARGGVWDGEEDAPRG